MSQPNPSVSDGTVPRHIAVIMDGNGRWASARGLPRSAGHRAGVHATRRLVEQCVAEGVQVLTVFAFSSENWHRPAQEVRLLMDLFQRTIRSEIARLHENRVRVRFIGARERFSHPLRERIAWAEDLTAANAGLELLIAVNYGGRWDIAQAARRVALDVAAGRVAADAVDEAALAAYLSTGEAPAPDLFIRTGGEHRLSNYLLWQLAYTELYFCDVLWPDFDAQHLRDALQHYAGKQRRFGRTAEQLRGGGNLA